MGDPSPKPTSLLALGALYTVYTSPKILIVGQRLARYGYVYNDKRTNPTNFMEIFSYAVYCFTQFY